jgi:hypothetical protein
LQNAIVALNERIIEDLSDDMVVTEETIPSEKLLDTDPRVLALIEDVSELIENIDRTVGCLIRLIPNLCDPFPLDLYSRSVSISDAYLDIDLAKELFPTASLALVDRLGRANWKRRQYLKILEKKSQPGIPFARARKSGNRQKKSALREVAVDAFNFQKPTLKFGSFELQTNDRPMANRSISDTTATPSVVDTEFSRPLRTRVESSTSLAQSEIPVKRLPVPKPPVPLEQGQAFWCLYCGDEINVGDHIITDKDWERHVFKDLEPYLCTFDDCLRAEKTYDARDDWFRHELDSHRIMKVWVCHACVEEFNTVQAFEAHLHEKHGDICSPSQVAMMVSLCMTHSKRHLEKQICPLCASQLKTEELKDHISDHLEQLALTSVDGDESSEEDDTDEIISQKFDDTASEGRTKLQILSAFAEEQFGYIHPGGREPPGESLGGTNLDFVGDSGKEDSQYEAELPVPRIERNWRVTNLLGDQPAEQAKTSQDSIKRSRSPRVFAIRKLLANCTSPSELAHSKLAVPPPRLFPEIVSGISTKANDLYDAICDGFCCKCPFPHQVSLGLHRVSFGHISVSEPLELFFSVDESTTTQSLESITTQSLESATTQSLKSTTTQSLESITTQSLESITTQSLESATTQSLKGTTTQSLELGRELPNSPTEKTIKLIEESNTLFTRYFIFVHC